MAIDNSFDRKTVERALFAAYMPAAADKRRTRKYLRKAARHIEHAWEIGFKDGRSEKPLIPFEALQKKEDSVICRGMVRRAYAAYQSGYRAGNAQRKVA